jgi:hypothetical protein
MNDQSGENTVLSQTTLTLNENGLRGKTGVVEVKYSWKHSKKDYFQYLLLLVYKFTSGSRNPDSAFRSSQQKKILIKCF